MNTLTHASSINVLLISCVLSAGVSLTSQAGDGVIVTGRTVQGHMYGRTSLPDPYPSTANANPSKEINNALTGELSDRDIGGISSGSSLARSPSPTAACRAWAPTKTACRHSALAQQPAMVRAAVAAWAGRSATRSSVA